MRKALTIVLLGYAAVAYGGSFDLDRDLRGVTRNAALFIDVNRPAVIEAIVTKWQGEFGDQKSAAEALQHLRGDQLYRVAIAQTFQDVMAAVVADGGAQAGKPLQKVLGSTTSDFTYVPITP